ncbi:hypothetical protein [Nostoc sp.]|uniref:hypothetical protein n=1 Tax=Nostoc sp. TaxID=1180 RepID=UPI002FFBA0E5
MKLSVPSQGVSSDRRVEGNGRREPFGKNAQNRPSRASPPLNLRFSGAIIEWWI